MVSLRPIRALLVFPRRVGAAAALPSFSDGCACAVTCTTQAEMKEPERDAIVNAVARASRARCKRNDVNGVKAATIPERRQQF